MEQCVTETSYEPPLLAPLRLARGLRVNLSKGGISRNCRPRSTGCRLALALIFGAAPTGAYARCNLDSVVGYTLVAAKYVAGYIENGERKDDFEGCNFDRIIVFDDNTGAKCVGYSYTYAYRPEAYIFILGNNIKACIEDEMYDLAPLR